MPTSRRRRPRRPHAPRSATPLGRVGPAEFAPYLEAIFAADAAEARGDAAGALAVMSAQPLGPDGRAFWRPWRVRRLRQVVDLGDDLPGWAVSRWVLAMALQSLDRSNPCGRARDLAIETRGGRRTLWGVDGADALCKVVDHDWVYRQLFLHELGGLDRYLRTGGSREVVEKADGIREWSRTPMGGYEYVTQDGHTITWIDLGSGGPVETINLGGACLLAPGEGALGRVVQVEGGAVFESAPLWVPIDVARRVAEAPYDWLSVLSAACRRPDAELLVEVVARVHDFDLLCDVPTTVRRALVVPPEDGWTGLDHDAGVVTAAVLGHILDEPGTVPAEPAVAAALLEPGVPVRVLTHLEAGDLAGVRRLEARLPEPAATVCRRLAAQLGRAA